MEDLTAILNECSARFSETKEYRILQTYRTRENRLNFDERLAIAKCVDRTFAPIFERMRADVPTLKDTDLLFCALSIQHFETIAIAECLAVSQEAVRMRKFRIREKLPAKWYDLLYPEQKRNSNADVTSQTCAGPEAGIPLLQTSTKNAKVMKEKMSFGTAVATCLSKYFTLNGRARRSEFWYFWLFFFIIRLLFEALAGVLELSTSSLLGDSSTSFLRTIMEAGYWVLTFILLIPGFTVSVRRLHDRDDNGWLAILFMVPVVLSIVTLIATDFSQWSTIDEIPSSLSTSLSIIALVLSFSSIASIIVFSKPGTEGPNAYGPDPIRIIPQNNGK